MATKKIIALICAVLMLTTVFASCSKKSGNVDLTGGDTANVTDANGGDSDADTDGTDANTAGDDQANNAGTEDPNAVPDIPADNPTVIVDNPPSYDDVEVVNVDSTRSKAGVSTTYFAADESYFYYVDNASENIYKVKIDGSDSAVKLCDDKVSTVDIAGGNKLDYTINMEDGMESNSFTMTRDGKNKVDNHELLLDYFGPTEYKKDGKVYSNLGMNEGFDKDGLYVRKEGEPETKATLVKEGYIESFCLVDKYIVLCISGVDGYGVYRMDLDGGNMVKLFTAQAYRITVVGNMIYFINQTDGGYIHQISVDAVKSAK